jgi:hypothetical protein
MGKEMRAWKFSSGLVNGDKAALTGSSRRLVMIKQFAQVQKRT